MKHCWFHIVCELDDDGPRLAPTIRDIQSAVCGRFAGVSVNDINSSRRLAAVILPRQIAMYLARELTIKSFPTIARAFGDRDPSTIMYGVRKIEHLSISDANLRSLTTSIAAELGVAA